MTATQLVVLIGILSVARGAFFLFPHMQVRTIILKAMLVLGASGLAVYFARYSETMEKFPMEVRIGVPVVLAIIALLSVPAGILSEQQKKVFLEYMDSIIIAGFTALILIWYFIRSFYIPSESMVPTLKVYDMILVDEIVYRVYRPARGDIIVFHPPEAAHSEGKDFIKRIVAVEGETIEVRNDAAIVNGVPLVEPYRQVNTDAMLRMPDKPPEKVPAGCVFVMGDNRDNSDDSRSWGPLPIKNIIGKAFVIFFPPRRIGPLR